MIYLVRTPFWIKKLFNNLIWDQPAGQKIIYLTFDDGPDPLITPFVLEELNKYNAKATFFCIGKNVESHPELYARIMSAGHSVGNHTYDHLDGWKTSRSVYLANASKAEELIRSNLFRPPYGHIKNSQIRGLLKRSNPLRVVMWTVLSGDFDASISPEKCSQNVIRNTGDGSIVVFHDSKKAEGRMRYALPVVLKHFSDRGFSFQKLTVK